MEEFKNITAFDVEKKLEGENLRVNRIISLALVGGPFLFFLVILYLYLNKIPTNMNIPPSSIEIILPLIFLFFAVVIYSTFFLYPKFYLKPESLRPRCSEDVVLPDGSQIEDPVMKLISLDRTMMIIRLAMLEGITLFAFVILLQSITNGQIYINNNLWSLVIPWLIQFLITIINYVPKDKIVSRIENDILLPIKNM